MQFRQVSPHKEVQLIALLWLSEIAWLELDLLFEGSGLGVAIREAQLIVFRDHLQYPWFVIPKEHPFLHITLEENLLFGLLLLAIEVFEVYLIKILEEFKLGGSWARTRVFCKAGSNQLFGCLAQSLLDVWFAITNLLEDFQVRISHKR